jgi:hypothetical protein
LLVSSVTWALLQLHAQSTRLCTEP